MRLLPIAPRQRARLLSTLLGALGIAFIVACNNTSAPTNSTASETPRGATQPRTQPPLPPVQHRPTLRTRARRICR